MILHQDGSTHEWMPGQYWDLIFYATRAGEKVDKKRLTQAGSAMRQLGIEMIPAYTPEARGVPSGYLALCKSDCPRNYVFEA